MDLGSGILDPGSGKNLSRIPDPGVKKAPDPGSGSATLIKREYAVEPLIFFVYWKGEIYGTVIGWHPLFPLTSLNLFLINLYKRTVVYFNFFCRVSPSTSWRTTTFESCVTLSSTTPHRLMRCPWTVSVHSLHLSSLGNSLKKLDFREQVSSQTSFPLPCSLWLDSYLKIYGVSYIGFL